MAVSYHPPQNPTGRTDPEDGDRARRIFQCVTSDAERAILGFSCEAGVRRNKGRTGAKDGPAAIRNALFGLAAPSGFSAITDLGDIQVEGDDLETGQQMLADHVSRALRAYKQLIVFGGGHETAFGSYVGLRTAFPSKKIGIINLDAHLDLRNIGDAGASSGTPFNQIRNLDPENFDYLCIGAARESNTQALLDRANDWGTQIIYDTDLATSAAAAFSAIDAMAERSDIIYLTVDIDLLPHYQAPGVSAPAVRGVSFAIVESIIAHVIEASKAHNALLPLADFVEVSPPHDKNNMTAKSAAILALSLLK
ncbi:MAG: formimidoylglutamase [Hyphomonadaceae bacterium]